ncbi:hypothetical protein EXIGLDRAFT_415313 [Exidia glandulosa HHB12029]|uniref:Uncharacterized protein n=1 Tax=Exidia glandulosa HHB12029 TaxID=1314781 RepID=A0A166BMX7_EXIGL|nr:hypothetical protein EXIGLDRAFT_415313 [Exidia glandulosa HHB12029]
MAYHTPFPTMISSRRRAASDASEDFDEDDVTVELDDHRRPRRFSSSSSPDGDRDTIDDEDDDVRVSVMGPKLTLVSRAPWEPGGGNADLLAEEDELDDTSSMLDQLSLFGGKGTSARGRKLAPKDDVAPSPTTQSGGIDWKRPFANTGSRSSSSTRPSREYRSPTTSAVYSNVLGARSAASLSVYSVASTKDLTANAPPLPASSSTGTTPPNSAGGGAARQRPPKVRARTTSAGTRSSVFSATSSHSHASDIPPMPRVPFADSPSGTTASFTDLESPTSLHPYANPDLLGDRDDDRLHRSESGITVTSSIVMHDDSGSMLAPSISATSSTHGAPTRSPRGPKSALTINAISTPLPAPPGVLGAHNMSGWGAVPGSPSYSLISLEQAQQKVRERTRSVYSTATSPSSPASGVFPPMPQMLPTRSRTTSGVGDPYFPPEPADAVTPSSAGPPPGKTVKPRRSGFMKLFKGSESSKEKEQPPAVPAVPAMPSRPTPQQQPSQRSLQSKASQPHMNQHARAMTSDHVSPTRRNPPSLSVTVTPSPQPVRPIRAFTVDAQMDDGGPPMYLGGGGPTSKSSLSPKVAAPAPPKSAPPTVAGFEGPALKLRPVSTLFSHLPENLFTPQPSPQSPGSSDGALSPAPELVSGWQRQIAELESQVKDLRAQLSELRAGAPCEHCGRGGATFGSPDKTPPAPSPGHGHGHGGHDNDDWKAAGVSVVDRPRARTAGRDRTTFAGMWRD